MKTDTITEATAPNRIVYAWMREHGIRETIRHVCRPIGVYIADDAPGLFLVAQQGRTLACYEDEDGEIHTLDPLDAEEGETL